MANAGPQTYVYQGKEFSVWTEAQLSAINREALKKRCMDLRDHIGQDRLPPMPRHPEGMVAWILNVQSIAMGGGGGGGGSAPEAYDDEQDRSQRAPPGHTGYVHGGRGGGQDDYEPSDAGSAAPSEAQAAYLDAKNAAAAIRKKNQNGGGGFW